MMTDNSNLQLRMLNFNHVSQSKLGTAPTNVLEVKLPRAKGPWTSPKTRALIKNLAIIYHE